MYIADGCFVNGPLTYPSQSYNNDGTSAIICPQYDPSLPPPMPQYFGNTVTRRFADRHLGTNCLFLGGDVRSYTTAVLDNMVWGTPDCVWDVN